MKKLLPYRMDQCWMFSSHNSEPRYREELCVLVGIIHLSNMCKSHGHAELASDGSSLHTIKMLGGVVCLALFHTPLTKNCGHTMLDVLFTPFCAKISGGVVCLDKWHLQSYVKSCYHTEWTSVGCSLHTILSQDIGRSCLPWHTPSKLCKKLLQYRIGQCWVF